MNKKNKILLQLAIFFLFQKICFADDRLDSLWNSFYVQIRENHFEQPVKMYEVNADYTTICFIYKGAVFLYTKERIQRVEHAKVFNGNGINRISYKKDSLSGWFYLWSNEKLILKISS